MEFELVNHWNFAAMLRRIGLMTFPLYLMHEAVGGVACGLLRQSGHEKGQALLLGLLLSVLISLFVVEFIEPWLRRGLLAVIHPLLHLDRSPL